MSISEITKTDLTRPRKTAVLHPSFTSRPSFGILSTFPPTACGLATFAAALAQGLSDVGIDDIGVVRIADDDGMIFDDRVVAQLKPCSLASRINAVNALDSFDFVLIQHEYGIFGGEDGDEILDILARLSSPAIVTLHTVPPQPTPRQKMILEEIVEQAALTVTMTHIARRRLLSVCDVQRERVVTIPHGATLPRVTAPTSTPSSPMALTWGLLGPGKGIEWVIDALALVKDVTPKINYVIAGQTHPKILANEGEKYRNMLKSRAERLGVSSQVTFDPQYRSLPELLDLISEATCVVLPYDSTDQITSGVLVDAVVAGRPVVATAFPHAVELLSNGSGMIVPHKDPSAIAEALRSIATSPDLVDSMSQAAEELAPAHNWMSVAARYVSHATSINTSYFNASSMNAPFLPMSAKLVL